MKKKGSRFRLPFLFVFSFLNNPELVNILKERRKYDTVVYK